MVMDGSVSGGIVGYSSSTDSTSRAIGLSAVTMSASTYIGPLIYKAQAEKKSSHNFAHGPTLHGNLSYKLTRL